MTDNLPPRYRHKPHVQTTPGTQLQPPTRSIFYTRSLGCSRSRMHEVTSLCTSTQYREIFRIALSRDELQNEHEHENEHIRRIVYVYPRMSSPQIRAVRSSYGCLFDWPSSICAGGWNCMSQKRTAVWGCHRRYVDCPNRRCQNLLCRHAHIISPHVCKSPSVRAELPFPIALMPHAASSPFFCG